VFGIAGDRVSATERVIDLNPQDTDSEQEGSVATFRFCRKTPRFRDFAEKPVVDFEALRRDGFRANPGFFGRIKSLQHFRNFGRISCGLPLENLLK